MHPDMKLNQTLKYQNFLREWKFSHT